jgi:hypothetical protein
MFDSICGVGLIIDDDVNDTTSDAYKISQMLSGNSIPLVKCDEAPSIRDEILPSFDFIILDWYLKKNPEADVPLSEDEKIRDSVKFLKEIKDKYFGPIFIITNEDTGAIQAKLDKLNEKNTVIRTDFISIEKKVALIKAEDLSLKIDEWRKKSASTYVLQEFNRTFNKACNDTFKHFYELDSAWPVIMHQVAKNDDMNQESRMILDAILRNIESRIIPIFKIYENNLNHPSKDNIVKCTKSFCECTDNEKSGIKKVFDGLIFLPKESLPDNDIDVGDLFKDGKNFYINIRPTCDLRADRIDDVQLYLIKTFGTKDDIAHCRLEPITTINKGENLNFYFKELSIKTFGEIKDKRIGRIIPPYITDLCKKYSYYISRQGKPRYPDFAVHHDA